MSRLNIIWRVCDGACWSRLEVLELRWYSILFQQRMALQQGIRERRQVLLEAHRLQRTELLQKLRDRCRERKDRPGEREIQELMGKRVKQDAPDYRASRNPTKILTT